MRNISSRITAPVVVFTMTVSGCGSLKPLSEPNKVAEVGRPLIFDGNRLLQEFAERRVEIDKAINSASIQDIETTARIASASSFQLGIDIGRNREPAAVDTYRAAQEANAQNSRNQIALQNVLVENASQQQDLANQQMREAIENSKQQTQLNKLRLENYTTLIQHYTQVLSTTPNTEENQEVRKDAINNLAAIRGELSAQSITSEKVAGPGVLTTPSVTSGLNPSDFIPTVEGSAATSSDGNTGTTALLNGVAERLASLDRPGSTRQERFQQYQAYIDELYGVRNQFLLDDSHRRTGRRMIRLVLPVYVPPSSSAITRDVRVKISNASKGNSMKDEEVARNLFYSKLQALNLLSTKRSDAFFEPSQNYKFKKAQISTWSELLSLPNESCISATNVKVIDKCWLGYRAALEVDISDIRRCVTFDPDNASWMKAKTEANCSGKFATLFDITSVDADEKEKHSKLEVYSIRPRIDREKIERESTRLFGVALALSELSGSTSSLTSATASARYSREQFAQAASRVPVVAAYTKNHDLNDKHEVGWHIYPRISISEKNKPVRKHMGTQFGGIIDISVPISWSELGVSVYLDRDSSPSYNYSVTIPPLSFQEATANAFRTPVVPQLKEYGIADPAKQLTIPVTGYNLWRNPEVLVGGRKADNIQFVSGSPNHLIAIFENLKGVACDYNRKNYKETEATYWGDDYDANVYCGSKIFINTAAGRAFVGSLLTPKPKLSATKPKPEPLTAKFQSATTRLYSLDLVIREPVESTYVDGAAAVLTETKLSGKGESVFMRITKQDPLSENPKLKLVTFHGESPAVFCRNSSGALLPSCVVTLSIGKSKKFEGTISIREIE